MRRWGQITGLVFCLFMEGGHVLAASEPPPIESALKPKILKRVLQERDVASLASLDEAAGGEKGLKDYRFHAAMLVRASLAQTRAILTDYRLYAEIIPYVDRADFDEPSKVLSLEGGIWKFKLISKVKFEEVSDRWIKYEFVDGHFRGMRGEIVFESKGEEGTLALLRGETRGKEWPPAFVMERGAEIVFGYTAGRMRSYIESKKPQGTATPSITEKNHDATPEPRRRL